MKTRSAYEIRRLAETGRDASFIAFHSTGPGEFMWHYHDYYELLVVTSGGGQWQIGTENGEFRAGEIYLTGPGLPHTYYSPLRTGGSEPEHFEATVIMLREVSGALVELEELRPLLDAAARGLAFVPPSWTGIRARCRRLEQAPGLAGLLDLLGLLLELRRRLPAARILSGCDLFVMKPQETARLDAIYRYLHRHYTRAVRLEELARQVGMSVSGLCAFFKRSTRKSVNAYLHELRIGHACRLLLETDLPVTEIAAAAGYNTLSCFNRKFLRLRACSPRDYRARTVSDRPRP